MLKHFTREFKVLIRFNKVIYPQTATRQHYCKKPEEQKITIEGQPINFVKVGTGDHHVFCLPGGLGSIWTDFKPQIEGIDKSRFTVVVWDPPGYGKSRPPNREYPPVFYYKDAEWAMKFMKALGISQYSLVGWSDGGNTALIIAAKQSNDVRKLVVVGSNAYVSQEDADIYHSIRDLNKLSPRWKEPLISMYGEEVFQDMYNRWINSMIAINTDQQEGDICKWLLPFIKCPTLVVHGKLDPMVPDFHPRYLVENIKGAKLHIFEKGKHNLHLRYADEFNKLIEKFLSS